MKLTNVVCAWLLILPFAIYFTACGRQEEKPASVKTEKKVNVVTTVAPITSIVENVAGDKIRLTGIIPEGVNSHTFEPVPSDVKILASADLLIVNGLDLEIPTLNLARANMKPDAAILRLGDKTITENEYIYDFSFPKDHGHPNPHLWLNPEHAMRYSMLVSDQLSRLDPKNKDAYDANSAAFLKKLEALDHAIMESIKTIPEENRRLLTYHDSWPYFARRYGFQIIGAVQPSDFSDPSPREVKRLIDQIRKEKVPAVFGSEVFPSPVLEQIAREGKSRYIDKLRDDALPGKPGDPQHSYIGMMIENLSTMFEALGGSAEALRKVDPAPVAGAHADYRRKD
jgi:ABC-type Zn uptake system ZnuABC Zn-binding protein ZnuA